MIFKETKLKDAFILEIEKLRDARGFFARTCCRNEFEAHGLHADFVQSNTAFSEHNGTLRGLHYQVPPFEETKLVRCTRGAIYDVIVDVRPESPTYKQWIGVELTGDNHLMLYVPPGFAHGYQTLVEDSEVAYQVSRFFCAEAERGVRWDDPLFRINWPKADRRMMSEKDTHWPDYRSYEYPGEQ